MLGDTSNADGIYIAVGHTDMRKSIDGLSAIVQQNFKMNPCSNNLFIFCGRRNDRIKALYWEGDGFCPSLQKTRRWTFSVASR